jgi:hypothetical protein
MNISGIELIRAEVGKSGYFFKAIINDSGVAFFPGSNQHSSVKLDGLSYEDDYRGNALAAIITNRRIEIRNHRDFGVPHVQSIIKKLLENADLEVLKEFEVSYRGNKL